MTYSYGNAYCHGLKWRIEIITQTIQSFLKSKTYKHQGEGKIRACLMNFENECLVFA